MAVPASSRLRRLTRRSAPEPLSGLELRWLRGSRHPETGGGSTDPAACLIEDALSWAAHYGEEEPNAPARRFAVWSCARDVIGHVLEIDDPDFCQDPPLLRYRWAADGMSDEDSMRDWVGSRPEWRQALERYCAARRREALKTYVARTVEAEDCGKRRAM